MQTSMNTPRRLFELLVVGGGLWIAGCGDPPVDTGTNTGANTVTLPDGGHVVHTGTGGGGGGEFW